MARTGKREQIMQAAEKLFTSKRLHEITLDDIAHEAHIGKGTIYTYFKDKDDLFFQVATAGFEELCDLLERRVVGDAPFEEQLLQACGAITAFFGRRRQLFRMIQTEDARMSLCRSDLQQRWQEKRQLLVEALGRILRKGQLEGLVRSGLSDQTLATFLMGLLRARGRNLGGSKDVIGDDVLVDLFMRGAGPRDAGAHDAGARDAGTHDAGARDAGAQDAGPRDAGARDAGQKAPATPGTTDSPQT
ncbi:MAG: TetR/AcrR family transcriptional regulator [Verrucomicrobia bacterium]|nr:TetR/AcrR family transcriptional regulator [Verrucomicrobiota bacterium]